MTKIKSIHKIFMLLLALVFLVIGIVAYATIPFPKFEQISTLKSVLTPDDKTGIFLSAYQLIIITNMFTKA